MTRVLERLREASSWSEARRPRVADENAAAFPADGRHGAERAAKLGQVGLWFCVGNRLQVVGVGFTALTWMLVVGLLVFPPLAATLGIVTIVLAARALGHTTGDIRTDARPGELKRRASLQLTD